VDLHRTNGTWFATVLTRDHPRLFASLAGTLAAFGMNILKTEAFANEQGLVLDTFAFQDPSRTLELNPSEAERLEHTLARAALGKEDVERLLRGRVRPQAAKKAVRVKPTVHFDSEASATATLVEIVAQDRPGLLYDLASTFSNAGCSIEVVLIDTEAHKALDVFYVTAGGKKLDNELRDQLQRNLMGLIASHVA
jgi:[protein-PII] uridylyltransferase